MSDLQQKFKSIVDDLEKNIKNQEELEYVKGQIYKMYTMFLDEFEKLEEQSSRKIDSLLERYSLIEQKMEEVESKMHTIEKDIYIDEQEESEEFEINCPYCAAQIIVDFSDELKEEITCPECNNTIELDWGNEDENECEHNCECCHHHESENEQEEIAEEDEDEDM